LRGFGQAAESPAYLHAAYKGKLKKIFSHETAMVTSYPIQALGRDPIPDPFSQTTPDMYHHSALQGIRQGNLLSGIEKIAKNNDLSKIKKNPPQACRVGRLF